MPFSHLRRRVDALKRKLAVPLAVVQLRPRAEEYCDQWATAVMSGEVPPPATAGDVRRPMPTAASARAVTSGGAHALGPSEDSDAVGEYDARCRLALYGFGIRRYGRRHGTRGMA